MDIDPPQFVSKDDEVQYWMELAHQIHRRWIIFTFLCIKNAVYYYIFIENYRIKLYMYVCIYVLYMMSCSEDTFKIPWLKV